MFIHFWETTLSATHGWYFFSLRSILLNHSSWIGLLCAFWDVILNCTASFKVILVAGLCKYLKMLEEKITSVTADWVEGEVCRSQALHLLWMDISFSEDYRVSSVIVAASAVTLLPRCRQNCGIKTHMHTHAQTSCSSSSLYNLGWVVDTGDAGVRAPIVSEDLT